MQKLKIYLAGFDVFLPNAITHGEKMKKICELNGFIGLYPLDNEVLFDKTLQKEKIALIIKQENIKLIKKADIVVSNLNPFRGFEMDSGTAYEIGFAEALEKQVFGYIDDTRSIVEKYQNHIKVTDDLFIDELSFTIENFDLPVNLMISAGTKIFQGGFENCIKNLAKIYN